MQNVSSVTPEAGIMRFYAQNTGDGFKIHTDKSMNNDMNLFGAYPLVVGALCGIRGIKDARIIEDSFRGYGFMVFKEAGYSWLDPEESNEGKEKCNLLDKCLEFIAWAYGKKPYLVNLEDYYG